MPVLLALFRTLRFSDVYEFGSGAYSTPMLGACTRAQEIGLYTGENDQEWMPTPLHDKHAVGSVASTWMSLPIPNSARGVLTFIDCEAQLRAPIADDIFMNGRANVCVIHDTEIMQERAYRLRSVLAKWRNHITVTCPFHFVRTSIVFDESDWVAPYDDLRIQLAALDRNPSAHATAWEEIKTFLRW
jgi:hypothetical protein